MIMLLILTILHVSQACITIQISSSNSCSFHFDPSTISDCSFKYCLIALPQSQQNETSWDSCIRSCCNQNSHFDPSKTQHCLRPPSSSQSSSDLLRIALTIALGIIVFPLLIYFSVKMYLCFLSKFQDFFRYRFRSTARKLRESQDSENFLKAKGSPQIMLTQFEHGQEALQERDCTICLQSDAEILANCEHSFHQGCIAKWLKVKNECPNCKVKDLSSFKIYCIKCRRNWISRSEAYDVRYRFECCNRSI